MKEEFLNSFFPLIYLCEQRRKISTCRLTQVTQYTLVLELDDYYYQPEMHKKRNEQTSFYQRRGHVSIFI